MALRGDKAPGPDGINPLFYQKNWPIMGKDLCHAILDVLNNGANLAPINETFVILIPKKNNDIRVQDFRPTSLCFTIYKVVAMSIAYKLKSVLGHVNIGSTLVSQFFFHNKKNCDIKEILLRGFDAFRKDNLAVFFGILWAIWNHRNKFLFADKKHVYMDIEPFIVSYLQDYKVAQAMIILQSDSSTQNQEAAQSRPTSSLSILEQYKLSVDAAIKRQVNKHGYGVVVQDSNDRVIAEIYSSTTSGVPPIFAEVEALL
uniref:Reverse transcriptase n=1 Tax=Cannabis sativa TaxID=3483 RepID=A0A803QB99_CANSA